MKQATQHTLLLLFEDATLGSAVSEFLELSGNKCTLHSELTYEDTRALDDKFYDLCLVYASTDSMYALHRLSEVREISQIPVFVGLNTSEKETQIEAYKKGADDVLISPVSFEILACKIAVLLGRLRCEEQDVQVYRLGCLIFNAENQTLVKNDEVIHHLSGKEAELLLLLAKNQNRLVERSLILRKIWKAGNYFNGRSLSVYVNHLRHKLDMVPNLKIMSIHGKGYKLCLDA